MALNSFTAPPDAVHLNMNVVNKRRQNVGLRTWKRLHIVRSQTAYIQ